MRNRLLALALVVCFVSATIISTYTLADVTAAAGQSGQSAVRETQVTRWVDPEGRKPMKYSEWKAKWGPEEPLKAEKVYETPQQARVEPAAPVFYVLVRWGLWDSIAERAWRYIHDVEDCEGWVVHVWLLTGGSAPGYRAWIIDRRAETGMDGLVLIGNFSPWHPWFEMDDDFDDTHSEFPCDLFFMDLDGIWTDTDGDGMYNTHSGNVAPEIYVGRLPAETLTLGGSDEITLINNYLDKDHKYRMHEYWLTHRALVYIDDDWVPWAGTTDTAVGKAYGTRTLVTNQWTTTGTDYKARLDDNYEWIHVEVHSSAFSHTFKTPAGWDGSVTNSEIRTIDPVAFFYNLFACSNARYVEMNYMGGWYIFTNTRGLAAVGSTKTGGMLQHDYFYTPLGAKKTLGEAFKAWFTDALGPTHDLGERQWFYGMTLLGDPALRTVVPYFTRTIAPGSATVQQGGSTTATVTVTSYDGYARTVSLTSADEPTGVTVSFSPASGTPTFSSTMTIAVGSTAPVGTHSIKVTVTGAEGQKIDASFMLTITAGPPTVTVKTDKRYPDPYVPGDTMTTSIRIVNPGTAKTVNFAWLLYVGTWVPILATPLPLPASSDSTYPIPIPVGKWSATSFDAAWVVALLKPSDNSIMSVDYTLWRYEPAPGTGPTTTPEELAAQIAEAVKDAASDAFPT